MWGCEERRRKRDDDGNSGWSEQRRASTLPPGQLQHPAKRGSAHSCTIAASLGSAVFCLLCDPILEKPLSLIVVVTEALWLDMSLECGLNLWFATHRCMSSDYTLF